MSILVEGSNCWRIARANRLAFLVDGSSYFQALREAICRARETILVVGWDIGDDATLQGEEQPSQENQFVELLSSCVEKQSSLHVYLLNWDCAVIYMFERKLFPTVNWNVHPRIHFRLDGRHPATASHHQKIVVIDDSIAFVGGFDITIGRWDTRKHIAFDPRRLDAKGEIHAPIHDVQVAIDGEPAALLGSMARRRWARATNLPVPGTSNNPDVWPEHLRPHMKDVDVAISRTIPAHENGQEIREVEQLYLDSIEAAKKFIYIENQYFTSNKITEALCSRLKEQNGPEIIMVLHKDYQGIVESATMGMLRKKVMANLWRSDDYKRLGVYYPLHKGQNVSINIHSKVMIVDDLFLRIGSSNLSNRSMGLDTECDVAVESEDNSEHREAIGRFRNALLAEHLGATADEIAQGLEESGSLLQTVKDLRNNVRTLEPISEPIPEWIEKRIPAEAFFDPERAIPVHVRLGQWFGRPKVLMTVIALTGLCLGIVWRKARNK